uniref:Uncharacterized protein n=1 Tax=virus sp. ctkyY8 TaxID=2827995 RepID=A0A8S5REK1_9VIRU|nr:MAG TPA: hypothetical protein [virus sp. ctkyY8]
MTKFLLKFSDFTRFLGIFYIEKIINENFKKTEILQIFFVKLLIILMQNIEIFLQLKHKILVKKFFIIPTKV